MGKQAILLLLYYYIVTQIRIEPVIVAMQKIDDRENREQIEPMELEEEIEEGQEIFSPQATTRNILPVALLLTFGVLLCIAIMTFYPAAVLGLPLIAVVAFFVVQRR
jgi:VIT1/CCC1 family predicted Fe2+/Mn2+ transporter